MKCRPRAALCLYIRAFAKILSMKISAVIIAGNEEEKIAEAIRSVDWADEVLVVDARSTDRTRETAEELGARVIVRPWPGFALQKQFGVDAAKFDWILSLDADERISPELTAEIMAIKNTREPADGYRFSRLAYYGGRPIRHCGWYPDWQLRLFDRRKGKWKNVLVHESVEMQSGAKIAKVSGGDILHFTMDGPEEHQELIDNRYAPLAARQMFDDGRHTSRLRSIAAAPVAFFSTYFLKLGFLDGLAGFHISRLAAYHARRKYEHLSTIRAEKP